MKSDDVDRIIEEMITDKNSLRKAAEMALETLCVGANDAVPNDIDERFEQAIQALRQALAHEALDRMVAENQRLGLYDDAVNMSQEPVDETAKGEHEPFIYIREDTEMPFGGYEHCGQHDPGAFPVYTALPKKEWVGLTDNEIWDLGANNKLDVEWAYEIEAKLKEKNGG